MGTNTDPYQPIEARYRLTRQVLELCLETRHPVTITTKSDRVLRDLDLLGELARLGLTAVAISVTSLDPHLSRLLEPRASAPAKRLAALGILVRAGVPAHVSIAPIVPAITDPFIEAILAEAGALGVPSASWIALRLPHEVAPLFREWLDTHFPDRASKVMATVREMRGGRDNDSDFFTRMKPQGVWADLIRVRFRTACRRAGIPQTSPPLDRGSSARHLRQVNSACSDPASGNEAQMPALRNRAERDFGNAGNALHPLRQFTIQRKGIAQPHQRIVAARRAQAGNHFALPLFSLR